MGEPDDASLGRALSFGIGPFLALELDEDPAVDGRSVSLGGFGGQLAVNLFDRLALVGGFAYLRDTSDMFDDGEIERTARRYQGELRLGYRIMPFEGVPIYVIPSLGATASWTTWTDRRLRIQLDDPSCDLSDGSACELTTDVVEAEDKDPFSVEPYLHLALRLGFLEAAYSLAYDPDGPGDLVHRFTLAAWIGH